VIRRALPLVAVLVGCATTPAPTPSSAAVAEPARVVERPSHIAHVNGIDVAWDSFGDPHAPPLLLIMGLGLQMIAWDDAFCEALAARGFYVIRYDNRDVGLSTTFDAYGDPNPLRVFDELRKKRPVRRRTSCATSPTTPPRSSTRPASRPRTSSACRWAA